MDDQQPKWEDFEDVTEEMPKWDDFEDVAPEESVVDKAVSEPSGAESAARGLAQGTAMGFAPEITAAAESALGSLGIVEDKTYQEALKETQALYDKAEKANPGLYQAGELAPLVVALLGGPAASLGKAGAEAAMKSKVGQTVREVNKAVKAGTANVAAAASEKTGIPENMIHGVLNMATKGLISSTVPGARSALRAVEGAQMVGKAVSRGKGLVKGALERRAAEREAAKAAEKAVVQEATSAPKKSYNRQLQEELQRKPTKAQLDSELDAKEDRTLTILEQLRKAPK